MSIYLCHEQPELLDFETEIVDRRPGAVLLARSALHPGGGGQASDQATLEHSSGIARIVGIELDGERRFWHRLDSEAELQGAVQVRIDPARRARLSQLHTDTHILNALVFQRFDGALVTGVQIPGDTTARMDFDLPDVDNDRLRSLEADINAAIESGLEVKATYVPAREADTTPGLVRSLAVAPPPTPDGRLRVIEIAGLDRQACGGTHLSNTAQSPPIRIVKIENKGRHNRRIRLALRDG
jgi:misacylated tRNA(Ala) deacylase